MKPLCLKTGYDSLASAERALEDVRAERSRPKGRNIRKVETRAYWHADCSKYHLTSAKHAPR